jgi:hypothetical protein
VEDVLFVVLHPVPAADKDTTMAVAALVEMAVKGISAVSLDRFTCIVTLNHFRISRIIKLIRSS